jgi:hypothetical protein
MDDELAAIFDRIAHGQCADADMAALRQFLEAGDRRVKAQFAKFNVNIGNGKGIHIGDKIYLELNDEIIRVIADKISSDNLDHGKSDKLISQSKSMNLPKNKSVYIYFSSCRQDEKILKELEKRLLVLEEDGIITILHSGRIGLGKNTIDERNEQLRKANVILLLVSTDYINSSEHRNVEVKQIMEKYNSGKAKVIPIITKKCHWEREVYKDLNPLPRDRKPIASSIKKDDIFSAIIDEIINEIRN